MDGSELNEAPKIALNNLKKPKVLMYGIIALAVLILGGGGYFAYAKYGDKIAVTLGLKDEAKTSTNANTNTASTVTSNVNANANGNTNADDETASWKTYTNDIYGFSFKYPSDLKLTNKTTQLNNDKEQILWISLATDKDSDCVVNNTCDKEYTLGMRLFNIGLESAVKDINQQGTYTEKTIKGNLWRVYDIQGTGREGASNQSAFMSNGGFTYYYSLTAGGYSPNGTFANFQPILEKVMATITITDETANWKTYNFTDYNTTVKYPSGYSPGTAGRGMEGKTASLYTAKMSKSLHFSLGTEKEWLADQLANQTHLNNLFAALKIIYNNQKIGDELASVSSKNTNTSMIPNSGSLSFQYIESTNGMWRGFTFFDTAVHGDIYFPFQYDAYLFNNEKGLVCLVTSGYGVDDGPKKLVDLNKLTGDEVVTARSEYLEIITGARTNTEVVDDLSDIDASIKSLSR